MPFLKLFSMVRYVFHRSNVDQLSSMIFSATKVSTSQNGGETTNRNLESRDNEEQRRRKAELKLAMVR